MACGGRAAPADRALDPDAAGRIFDRHAREGEELAIDEPSFDVLVDYRVITGEWAFEEARRRVSEASPEEWDKLDEAGRAGLVEPEAAALAAQLSAGWDEVAGVLGVSREELEGRKADVKRTVQELGAYLRKRWLARDLERLNDETLTFSDFADVPIREERQPHLIARGVDDATAFEARRLGVRSGAFGDAGFPGLHVVKGGRRVYRTETMRVEVDRSTFPSALRDAEGADPVTIDVGGVATHIVGWMRSVQERDLEVRGQEKMGDAGRDDAIDRGHYRTAISRVHRGSRRGTSQRCAVSAAGPCVTWTQTRRRCSRPSRAVMSG